MIEVFKKTMEKRIFLISLFMISVQTGCATSALDSEFYADPVQKIYDEFEGATIYRMRKNMLLSSEGLFSSIETTSHPISLTAQKYITKEGVATYSLIVQYEGDNWIFIQPGESLKLLIDSEKLGLSGPGSINHRNTLNRLARGLGVLERAWYDISADDLRRIANAKEVKVRIIGSEHYIDRYLSEYNIRAFQDFVVKYVSE